MKLRTLMSTYGPALIPFGGLALILTGMAVGVCDAVIGGLMLSVLLSFGESVTYTALACISSESAHARPYSFMAGANWTTTAVLAMLLLSSLGLWTPIPAMTHVENGLSSRSHERSQALSQIEALQHSRKHGEAAVHAATAVPRVETASESASKQPEGPVSPVLLNPKQGETIAP